MDEAAFDPLVNIVHMLPFASSYAATESFRCAAHWWRTTHSGVYCLVGIGGSGKTAAADQLLRQLGVLAPLTGADVLPPRPGAAFVFTLAQDSVEVLTEELRQWVPRMVTASGDNSYEGLLRDLSQAGRCRDPNDPILIVIDGLEVVQSVAGADGIGRITDHRLRDLLTRSAYGALPGIALLVTTRLTLTDIEIQRLPLYTRVDVDQMDTRAAVELLRSHGLHGSDRELRRISDSYGFHALTMDLAGRYAQRSGRLPASIGDELATEDVIRAYVDLARSGTDSPDDSGLVDLLSFFRRGVTPTLLASAARTLRVVDQDRMGSALDRLTDLRLVSRTDRRGRESLLAMHEVIRTFVHGTLPPERRRTWHSEIARLQGDELQRHWSSLDDADQRDGLDRCLSHLVQGENPIEAFEMYWRELGNFQRIGHESSSFAWGESLCRTLNEDEPPDKPAPYLQADPRGSAAALLGDWALYLQYLGETSAALAAHEAGYRCARQGKLAFQLPVAASNVAYICVQRGELRPAHRWAETADRHATAALKVAEGMPTAEVMHGFDESTGVLTQARLPMFGAESAAVTLDHLAALHAGAAEAIVSWNRSTFRMLLPEPPAFDKERFFWGRPLCEILLARGDTQKTIRLAESTLSRWFSTGHAEEHTSVRIRALLVRALTSQGQIPSALPHLEAMETWADSSETTIVSCEAHLLRARIAAIQDDHDMAAGSAQAGLLLAREGGFGLLHIDLLIELARASLQLGEPEDAAYAAATALFGQEPLSEGVALYAAPARDERLAAGGAPAAEWHERSGIFPPAESGRPALLASTHPQCGYRWGEAYARAALAESLLATLAAYSGHDDWTLGNVSPAGHAVISYAAEQLGLTASLLEDLTGSAAAAEPYQMRIRELSSGMLTRYPTGKGQSPTVTVPVRRRILISYSRSDSEFVDRLADELKPAAEDVWVDRRKISVGDSFVAGINAALAHVTDFVVVLSAVGMQSRWVQNELGSAIALRNSGRPLTIYPVILDDTETPPLIADLDAIRSDERDARSVAARIAAAVSARQ